MVNSIPFCMTHIYFSSIRYSTTSFHKVFICTVVWALRLTFGFYPFSFNLSYCGKCVVVLYYGFNLHFPGIIDTKHIFFFFLRVTESLFCFSWSQAGDKTVKDPFGLHSWLEGSGRWAFRLKLLGGDREVEGLTVPQVTRVQTVTGSSEGWGRCVNQLGQRRRAKIGHRSLAGSERAHFALSVPTGTEGSSRPTSHTAHCRCGAAHRG